MKKPLIIVLTVCLVVMSLAGCGGGEPELPEGAVKVAAAYPNLDYIAPGEFEYDLHEDPQWYKMGYNTYVAEVNGMLCVLPSHSVGNSKTLYIQKETQYKFGQSIKGDCNGVYIGDERVSSLPCVGMISDIVYRKALTFTTDNEVTYVHSVAESGISDSCHDLQGKLLLICCDWNNINADAPEQIYLITDKEILIMNADRYLNYNEALETVTFETVTVPEWWQYIDITSAVIAGDGTLFIGERCGVIGVRDGVVTYYPIDYLSACSTVDE